MALSECQSAYSVYSYTACMYNMYANVTPTCVCMTLHVCVYVQARWYNYSTCMCMVWYDTGNMVCKGRMYIKSCIYKKHVQVHACRNNNVYACTSARIKNPRTHKRAYKKKHAQWRNLSIILRTFWTLKINFFGQIGNETVFSGVSFLP